MSAEIIDYVDGVLRMKVTGLLRKEELERTQDSVAKLIQKQGNLRILVMVEKFNGWEKSDKWGDLSFMEKFDTSIEKIAIVGEKKWEEMTLLFVGKDLRKAAVEYFQPSEMAKAETWLKSR